MWMPLVGPLPTPSWFNDAGKLVYVIAVRFSGAVLANVMIWSGSVLYPDYAAGEAEWGISPLADQGAAGNLMMIETGAVTLGLFTWLFFRAANRSAEKQELLELAEREGVELDPARAARAVSAGQGERLRKRIMRGDGGPLPSS
jgi:cytochrome c oxidase assembly factor CtaG